ncbi:hypothetical protein, partial [Rhizobium laguerreae]
IATAVSRPFKHVATATYIAPSNRSDRRADAAFPEDAHQPEFQPRHFQLVQNSLFNYFILVSIRSGIFRKGETHDGRQTIDF